MIILQSTDTLRIVCAAATSAPLPVWASWADEGATPAISRSSAQTNGTTSVDVVAAPAASYQRVVKSLTVWNAAAAAAIVTLSIFDGTNTRTLKRITIQPGANAELLDNAWLSVADFGPAAYAPAGAKGLALLALADDAALQTEIVARLAGATIAPAQVNATGGVTVAAAAAVSGITLFQVGNPSIGGNGTSANARGAQSWYVCDDGNTYRGEIRYATPGGLPGISIFGADGGDRSDIIGAASVGGGFLFRLGGLNRLQLSRDLPAASTAGQTNIGGGRVDTADRIISRSTAVDSIETAGGIRSFSTGNSEWFLESGNGSTSSINFNTGASPGGRRWFFRKGIEDESGSNAGSPFQIWARNDTGGAIDTPLSITRAANGLIELRRPTQITGSLPAASTAGQTNIGGGRIDTAERIISRSTAADAIESLGGIKARDIFSLVSTGNADQLFAAPSGFAANQIFAIDDTLGGRRWFVRKGTGAETGSNAGSPFEIFARNDTGGAIDVPLSITRAANGLFELRRPTQITGSLPAASTSGQTNIGAGRIDTFERIISRSTAANAIESLGGITGTLIYTNRGVTSAVNNTWVTLLAAIPTGIYMVVAQRQTFPSQAFVAAIVSVGSGSSRVTSLDSTGTTELRLDSGNLQLRHQAGFTLNVGWSIQRLNTE